MFGQRCNKTRPIDRCAAACKRRRRLYRCVRASGRVRPATMQRNRSVYKGEASATSPNRTRSVATARSASSCQHSCAQSRFFRQPPASGCSRRSTSFAALRISASQISRGPRAGKSPAGRRLLVARADDRLDRHAYTFCVLERLQDSLRQPDGVLISGTARPRSRSRSRSRQSWSPPAPTARRPRSAIYATPRARTLRPSTASARRPNQEPWSTSPTATVTFPNVAEATRPRPVRPRYRSWRRRRPMAPLR
jgi:hypothetical protein